MIVVIKVTLAINLGNLVLKHLYCRTYFLQELTQRQAQWNGQWQSYYTTQKK